MTADWSPRQPTTRKPHGILHIDHRDYEEKWDTLYDLFSKRSRQRWQLRSLCQKGTVSSWKQAGRCSLFERYGITSGISLLRT